MNAGRFGEGVTMDKEVAVKVNDKILIKKALEARNNAYAVYSEFMVGAALLCADGSIYAGCNVENAAYPTGICAERVALGKAISKGQRDFVAMAIVGGKQDKRVACFPCGICRQAISEFVTDDFIFIIEEKENINTTFTMNELLPHRFKAEALK